MPAWGLSLYFLKVASHVIRIWLSGSGEGSEAAAATQEYGLMLKHRICQPAFASSVAVGAFGGFVRITPCSRDNRSGWCPGAVLGWMGFLRQG